MGSKLLLNIPDRDAEMIEALVKAGEYATKSELIRTAIKQYLYNEERMRRFEELAREVQKTTKSKKQVQREIEWAKEGTRRILEAEEKARAQGRKLTDEEVEEIWRIHGSESNRRSGKKAPTSKE